MEPCQQVTSWKGPALRSLVQYWIQRPSRVTCPRGQTAGSGCSQLKAACASDMHSFAYVELHVLTFWSAWQACKPAGLHRSSLTCTCCVSRIGILSYMSGTGVSWLTCPLLLTMPYLSARQHWRWAGAVLLAVEAWSGTLHHEQLMTTLGLRVYGSHLTGLTQLAASSHTLAAGRCLHAQQEGYLAAEVDHAAAGAALYVESDAAVAGAGSQCSRWKRGWRAVVG